MTYSKLYIYLKIILYKFYLIERKLHFTKTCLMQTLPHNKPVPFTIWFPRNFLPKKMCFIQAKVFWVWTHVTLVLSQDISLNLGVPTKVLLPG